MKTLLVLFLFVVGRHCSAADPPAAGSTNGTRYYVQLIQGSDQLLPPIPGARLVGPKIRKQLDPVFRWKSYWEIQRSHVGVEAGRTGRVNLTDGRSLVIDLRQPGKRAIHIYRGKTLVRIAVCALDKEICIQGTETTDGVAWFVVVRTDPPAT